MSSGIKTINIFNYSKFLMLKKSPKNLALFLVKKYKHFFNRNNLLV